MAILYSELFWIDLMYESCAEDPLGCFVLRPMSSGRVTSPLLVGHLLDLAKTSRHWQLLYLRNPPSPGFVSSDNELRTGPPRASNDRSSA